MTPARQPLEEDCDNCPVFFKCDQLPPCATHSSPPAPASCPAQDVLDFAIKDLEREIKDQQWMIDNYKGHHKEIHENISKALRYALNLLRGNPP